MSEESKKLQTTFENIRKIYRGIGSLLQDVDSLMDKVGYECAHSPRAINAIATEQSKDLRHPEWWITPYAARYYSDNDNPHVMKGVGVLFVDVEDDYEPIEPIILFGTFIMKTDEDIEPLGFDYWYLRAGWSDLDEPQIGSVYELQEKNNYIIGKISSIKLENVKDMQMLNEKVVQPLLSQ